MSKIEWTGISWNPTVGCSEKSAGCRDCYAAKMAFRLAAMGQKSYQGLTKKTSNKKIVWTGKINLLDDVLLKPARIKKPTFIFPGSMSDLFHEDIPFSFIDKIFAVMMLCPQHTFQVLTKRTGRMLEYCQDRQDFDQILKAAEIIVCDHPELFHETERANKIVQRVTGRKKISTGKLLPHLKDAYWSWDKTYTEYGGGHTVDLMYEGEFPAKHIWLGTSIEDQKAADERGKPLYELHRLGWVTWVSNEPFIGPINWEEPNYFGFLDWIVTGGESGSTARPMHLDWARASRDFCAKNNIPFFFKQWGQHLPMLSLEHSDKFPGKSLVYVPEHDQTYAKIGKHDAGRMLDGVLHEGMPQIKQEGFFCSNENYLGGLYKCPHPCAGKHCEVTE